jgi:glutamate N-acetyltransferase/amino-acid N-acetyltransferase
MGENVENITCKGFKAAGVASGLKKNGGKDLGLIYSEVPATVAGVFTKNLVQAAPVLLDRERIKFEVAIPDLVKAAAYEGLDAFAEAIMTTDTIPKVITRHGKIEGKPYTVIGVAKGSGMIRPDMATMLCFVVSDIKISHDLLTAGLLSATDKSFNKITVDGDTSTNDTILVLANGLSGATVKNPAQKESFQIVLDEVLTGLAKMVVKDGEGATKLVEIIIRGALTDKDAYKIADTVSNSNLVKTALFGEDANWGRILAAAGRAGVKIDPYKADIFFDDVMIAKNGMWCGEKAEEEAAKILKRDEFVIFVDLNMGRGSASVLTCDFSIDYVKINADYRS